MGSPAKGIRDSGSRRPAHPANQMHDRGSRLRLVTLLLTTCAVDYVIRCGTAGGPRPRRARTVRCPRAGAPGRAARPGRCEPRPRLARGRGERSGTLGGSAPRTGLRTTSDCCASRSSERRWAIRLRRERGRSLKARGPPTNQCLVQVTRCAAGQAGELASCPAAAT